MGGCGCGWMSEKKNDDDYVSSMAVRLDQRKNAPQDTSMLHSIEKKNKTACTPHEFRVHTPWSNGNTQTKSRREWKLNRPPHTKSINSPNPKCLIEKKQQRHKQRPDQTTAKQMGERTKVAENDYLIIDHKSSASRNCYA